MTATAVKAFAPRDLILIHAETDPRVSSIRVAERIHKSGRAQLIHDFVERNRAELERYGPLTYRTFMVRLPQGGSRRSDEYLLNEDQVTIVIMRSDSPEAADGRFEIVQLIRAYRRGEIPQSQITIIADLFDPRPATIERGDDNVVHVRREPTLVPEPNALDELIEPKPAHDDEDDTNARRVWNGRSLKMEALELFPTRLKPGRRYHDRDVNGETGYYALPFTDPDGDVAELYLASKHALAVRMCCTWLPDENSPKRVKVIWETSIPHDVAIRLVHRVCGLSGRIVIDLLKQVMRDPSDDDQPPTP